MTSKSEGHGETRLTMGQPPVSRQGTGGGREQRFVYRAGERRASDGVGPGPGMGACGTWDVPRPSFSLHDAGQAGDPSVTLDLATERGQSRTCHLSVMCPGCASAEDSGE